MMVTPHSEYIVLNAVKAFRTKKYTESREYVAHVVRCKTTPRAERVLKALYKAAEREYRRVTK